MGWLVNLTTVGLNGCHRDHLGRIIIVIRIRPAVTSARAGRASRCAMVCAYVGSGPSLDAMFNERNRLETTVGRFRIGSWRSFGGRR